MFARIRALAINTAWEALRGQSAALVYFALVAWALLWSRQDPVAPLIEACGTGGWVAAWFALNAVFDETRQRTLVAVMVRPVARWEYLAGRAAGIVGIFWAFVVVCGVLALMLSGGALDLRQLQQWVGHAVTGTTWVLLLLPLAALLRPWPCAVGLAGLWALRAATEAFGGYWQILAALQPVLFYGSFVQVDYINPWLWLAALVDNLAYAAVLFVVCTWIYDQQDVRLREM